MPINLVVLWIVLIIAATSSIKIIRENQRAAVFRLGRFVGVRGPGLIYVVPIIDKTEIVDLNKWVPEWRGLSKSDLEDRVKSVALSRPEK
jgi:regulator of protease activity HflC (stomatin/prohibitin superfamily)